MLISATPEIDAVRFATADSPEKYGAGRNFATNLRFAPAAMEECFFLGCG